jgi:PAS domain S-box-containing protein
MLKSVEERSRQASTYARALFEASIDPLATITLDGRIVDANQAMMTATGTPRNALLGRDFGSFFRDENAFRDAMDVAAKRGIVRDEVAILPTGADERTFLVNGTLMEDARFGTRVILVAARDVTERLRLESEAALQREAMARQERLSSLGTLVAGVAHEINNPLTYLAGNIELALLDVAEAQAALASGDARGGPDLAETARGLKTALSGAERIAHITKALKAVSRQRTAAAPEDLRFNALLANVQALLGVALPDGVVLEVAPDPADPVARAPSAEMHQVLLNLARNAIDAVAERAAGHVWIASRATGEHAELEVRDDGPGMPPDVQAKLFTPFFTTKPHGTGLGLSIVHSIVQEQKGEILVRSAPGRGTTVLVRFPRVRSETADAPTTRETAPTTTQ